MRTLRLSSVLLPVLLSLPFNALFAQNPAAKDPPKIEYTQAQLASPASDRYAGESIVILKSEDVYSMNADGTGWRLRTIAARVQSDAAVRQLGVIGIPFAGSSERAEIQYARVRRPDGSVIETPIADSLEMPEEVTRQAPFYSDLKQKQLPIRNLRVGDTLEWQAKIVRTKAEAPGEFWGQQSLVEDSVVLDQAVELRIPKGKTVNVWSPTLKPVESVAGDQRILRWTGAQTKPTTGSEATADAEAKKKLIWTPEQELDAAEGKLPTIAWTTFPTWEAVGAWYRGLEADRMDPGPEVKAKVAEITAGKTTDEDKVRAVYAYVATQIRYIGIAFGVGRYQPHRAAEVLENQYGDCKDKHTLLAAMLTALGLKPEAVLIGAGIRFNPDVPSPSAFNHLITLVSLDGKPVWLDTTSEVAPYRMLLFPIRDHKALVIPAAGTARVERTPKEIPFKPFQRMEAVGSLDKDGISNSKMTLTFRGDEEVGVRMALRQIAPAQYDQVVQNISGGMGYGGTTSHGEIGRVEDTADPLTIRYDYHREKAGNDWEHYRTIAQLAPVTLPAPDDKDPPVRSIQLGVPRIESSTSEMKLPEGWTAEVPEASHIHSPYANFDQTYRFEKGTLYADRKIEVLVEKVPQAEWKKYKKFTDQVYENNDLYVQLTHTGAKSGDSQKAESKSSEPAEEQRSGSDKQQAAKLVQSAFEAIERQDLKSAGEKLDEAKALNASQIGLWAAYGYVALRRSETTEAMRLYQKEITLHPENESTYPALAALLTTSGKLKESIEVLRIWVAQFPANGGAVLALVGTLNQDQDWTGAVAAAESGIKTLPETDRQMERIRLQLGIAQMKSGSKEKGSDTLAALLKNTEDPGILNDAAYELADAGQRMDIAEASTRAALEKLGTESKTWTLDENSQLLRGKTQLIVATWDTMGWILFHEKKMADAETYLRAAWLNGRHVVVGEHLGDLLVERGDRPAAIKAYREALGAVPPSANFLGVRDDKPNPDATRLEQKLRQLEPATARKPVRTPPGTVIAQASTSLSLTLPLGPAQGRNGTAEYKMLLSPGKIERVIPAGEKTLPNDMEIIKQAKLEAFWPKESEARLVKGAFLNCHSGVCELVLTP